MKLNELSIEIIKTCPNNCLFCSSRSTPQSQEILTLETIEGIVVSAKELGVKNIHLSGGEPFMHPDLLKIATFIKSKNLKLNIYTSGIVLDTNAYTAIDKKALEALKDIGVDKVIFDVQAASPDLYDLLMGTQGQFPNLLTSMKHATDAGHWVEFHYIPTKLNAEDFTNVLNLANELNAKGVSVLRFVNQGRGRDNQKDLEMSMEELIAFRDFVRTLIPKYPNLNIRIGHPMLLDNKVTHLCTAATGKLVITYEGLVYPCESYKWMKGFLYQNDWEEGYFEPDSIHEFPLTTIYEKSWFLNKIREDIEFFKGIKKRRFNEILLPFSREATPCQQISRFERKFYKKDGCLLC